MSKLPYEIINHGLSHYPNVEEYEEINGVTHYNFQVFFSQGYWGIKARPYQNWRERQLEDMKNKGCIN